MKYFKLSEFACNCGCGKNKINRNFVRILSSARQESIDQDGSEIPFVISSGYRCENHIESINYVKRHPAKKGEKQLTSEHTKGLAADIVVKNSRERAVILGALMNSGLSRFGISHNRNGFSFIHVDMADEDLKPPGVIWTY